jgi:hypothetical protein
MTSEAGRKKKSSSIILLSSKTEMVLLELFHQKWTLNIIMQGGKKLTK